MANLFLSYDRDDLAKAKALAGVLEAAGHDVWWDGHIRGGAEFSEEIERALEAADKVVVLWSANSVRSAWVRDEAAAGRDSGRLIPVLIEAILPPMGFRQFQAIDLSRWSPRRGKAGLGPLLAAIGTPTEPAAPRRAATGRRAINWRIVAVVAALLLLTVGGAWWTFKEHGASKVQTVAVVADQTSSAPLARDLLTRLGALQSTRSESLRLVGDAPIAGKANLLLQASAGPDLTGNLALLDGKDRSVLWSSGFPKTSEEGGDLLQRMSITAGKIVGCAVEGKNDVAARLDQQTVKLFLNACALQAQVGWDKRDVVSALRKVVDAAPRFRTGWAALLKGDIDLRSFLYDQDPPRDFDLVFRRDIQRARQVDPAMAEIKLAEAELLPPMDHGGKLKLVEQALALNPDNPAVLSERSHWLSDVGRMTEAVDDARRSVALDPLSPEAESALIGALLYSGDINGARAELAHAKQLWPGAKTIEQAEYGLDLRAGDFEKALRSPFAHHDAGSDISIAIRRDPNEGNVRKLLDYVMRAPRTSQLDPGPAQLLGSVNRPSEFYRLADYFRVGDLTIIGSNVLFRPWMKSIRDDPRFIPFAKRLGLVGYWRSSGKWPDFCGEPDLPYDCKAEAAKLG